MEPSSELNKGNIKKETTKRSDVSQAFNLPAVSRETIGHFQLQEDEVTKILEEYQKLDGPLSLAMPKPNETDDERRKRELLRFALDAGSSSRNFRHEPDGNLSPFLTDEINYAVLAKTTKKDILKAQSVEDISEKIGPEVKYKTVKCEILPEGEVDKLGKKIISKEPLFDTTVQNGENSFGTLENVRQKTIDTWENMASPPFGKAQSPNYLVKYSKERTVPTAKVIEELNIGGQLALNTFAKRMVEHSDAVYGSPISRDVLDSMTELSKIAREASSPIGTGEPNLHFIKINFILSPYLSEVDTEGSMKEFGFHKYVPDSVIIRTIEECKAIVEERKR